MDKLCIYCNKPLKKHFYDGFDYDLICDCEGFQEEQNYISDYHKLCRNASKTKNIIRDNILKTETGTKLVDLIQQKLKIDLEINRIVDDYNISSTQLQEFCNYAKNKKY